MQILIVNDDGIEYEGIHILAELAKDFGDVTVVAPMKQCSAMSHRVSIDREQSIRRSTIPVEGCKAYAVDGTPADCVKVAIGFLGLKPDYVFPESMTGSTQALTLPTPERSVLPWKLSCWVFRPSPTPDSVREKQITEPCARTFTTSPPLFFDGIR